MPVTVKVNGTVNSLVHKGSNGISMATIPDVCKTPSPGGPIPIPYPNISQAATLAKGTITVKADGMMIAIKGSEFSLSNGDNAGVAGGVKSSTFMKESTWILYSFDVKMDGQNAARLTDKKFQNHENTADMAGTLQPPVVVVPLEPVELLQCIACKCDAQVNQNQPNLNCRQSGTAKHNCCENEIQQHRASGNPPAIDGERGYSMGPPLTGVVGSRAANFAAGTLPAGSCWPDAAALDADGNVQQFFDFKFKCSSAKYAGPPTWSRRGGVSQFDRYDDLSQALNPNSDPPEIVHNQNCPPPHSC